MAAQTDTLLLPEFEKQELRLSQVREFLPVIESDSAASEFYRVGPVTELLQQTYPIMLRNMGPSGSVTLSSRGLAAAHTAVYWNGISINSPASGLADFSLIPAAFVETSAFTLGGNSAVSGSGPIGGGFHLNAQGTARNGLQVELVNTLNSAQNFESSVRAAMGNGKWTSKTNLLMNESQNRYPYVDHAQGDQPVRNREHSHFRQYGFTQQIGRRIGKHKIALDLWGLQTERQLPPGIYAASQAEQQSDRNLKAVLQGHFYFGRWNSRIQVGYLHDELHYENETGVNSTITTSQWIANADFSRPISSRWQVRLGTNNQYQQARANENYTDGANQLVNALYSGLHYESENHRWSASAMLRYDHFQHYRGALSPSLAVKFSLPEQLEWHFSASRNYRIPALNDRFWVPGGNPDLDPEDAYQLSAGPDWTICLNARHQLKINASGFYNHVQNWIQWVPQSNFWGAVSYKSVNTYGLNSGFEYDFQREEFRFNLRGNYVFTEARNLESSYNEALSGRRLLHVPNHRFNARIAVSWKGLSLYSDISYVGERLQSSDRTALLDPIGLTNAGVGYNLDLGKIQTQLSFRVLNLLNADYQVMPGMPMPLRTYSISLKIAYHQIKN